MSEGKRPTRIAQKEGGGARPAAGALLGARLGALIELWRSGRKALGRPGGGGRLTGREIEDAGAALLALQRGLTGDRALAGSGYMEDEDLLGAYLLYYWPVSYMQVSLALAERPFSPSRVLDLGSGPRSRLVGDNRRHPPRRLQLEALVLVDSSTKALDLAEAIAARGPRPPARIERRASTSNPRRSSPMGRST